LLQATHTVPIVSFEREGGARTRIIRIIDASENPHGPHRPHRPRPRQNPVQRTVASDAGENGGAPLPGTGRANRTHGTRAGVPENISARSTYPIILNWLSAGPARAKRPDWERA
jgi:hypothetical protein